MLQFSVKLSKVALGLEVSAGCSGCSASCPLVESERLATSIIKKDFMLNWLFIFVGFLNTDFVCIEGLYELIVRCRIWTLECLRMGKQLICRLSTSGKV